VAAQGPGLHLAIGPPLETALAARDRFARWLGEELSVPAFLYGPDLDRSLPMVRRQAFSDLRADFGPDRPHPSAGSSAVGSRPFLIAYNVWLRGVDMVRARLLAASLRGPGVRALALELNGRVQVSCNLVDPLTVGPLQLYDKVARHLAEEASGQIDHTELVGLVPASVLDRIPPTRWSELDLSPSRTVEARLEETGFSWR